MLTVNRLTPHEALIKIKSFCAYQERCHAEVKDKLYSYGLTKTDAERITSTLIEEGFLNEERFAIQFAGGKFRIKKWGKVRIKHALMQKRVSSYCIKTALKHISETEYLACINKLAGEKLKVLKGNQISRKAKLYAYLVQKGYESSLVQAVIAGFFKT